MARAWKVLESRDRVKVGGQTVIGRASHLNELKLLCANERVWQAIDGFKVVV